MEVAFLLWAAVILAASLWGIYRISRSLSGRLDRLEARCKTLENRLSDQANRSSFPLENPYPSRQPPPIPPLASSLPPVIPIASTEPPKVPTNSSIQWEQFFGVKLIAWISGFVLFLGSIYFVKYSFDNHWINREIQMSFAFIVGAGLLIWGVLLKHESTAARALCATGIVILYAVCHASHVTYGLIESSIAFPLMVLVSVAAFTLAVRMNSKGIAFWGVLGGFLTPILIPLGHHDALSFFGYIAILDASLLSIAFRKRWKSLVLLASLGTFLTQAGWMFQNLPGFGDFSENLMILGSFPLLFFGAGLVGIWKSIETPPKVPLLPIFLSFPLLMFMAIDIPEKNLSSFFAFILFLSILILAGCHLNHAYGSALIGLLTVWILQWILYWNTDRRVTPQIDPLFWGLVFTSLFTLYPFPFTSRLNNRVLPWAIAALSAPLHFYLLYRIIKLSYHHCPLGLLPVAFAIPEIAALAWIRHKIPSATSTRPAIQAWFGASALFFITLIFPVLFRYEWIVMGWALEGAALLWLLRYIPLSGLRYAGMVLLTICFTLLLLGTRRFHSYQDFPVWIQYLYIYGTVIVSLAFGARWLASTTRFSASLLCVFSVALGFRLMNLEIDDYFLSGFTEKTSRSHLARDMIQSLAWALFAFGLLLVGMVRNRKVARYAGIALLGITLSKLFLHDLAHLRHLYRIGALVGVSIIGFVASFLYQRYLVSREIFFVEK